MKRPTTTQRLDALEERANIHRGANARIEDITRKLRSLTGHFRDVDHRTRGVYPDTISTARQLHELAGSCRVSAERIEKLEQWMKRPASDDTIAYFVRKELHEIKQARRAEVFCFSMIVGVIVVGGFAIYGVVTTLRDFGLV